ncbi:MAG: putative ATP:guanido phosphotransferase [Candidatus Omnitrophica bacterium ADurb.Bin314]|jgi:protein arginine kinase|nr:MAG: putative ATP:guanido phosphotransferase [Candidatus Omnitrophica bacterium ADurb.Bin314]HOE68067.1 protein arginine kinase [Candidatus Omnitrophota bacterium]
MTENGSSPAQSVNWLRATGPENDVVVSSRIRLARNLANYPFLIKMTPDQRIALIAEMEKAVRASSFLKKANMILTKEIGEIDRQFLLERYLISNALVREDGASAVVITPDEMVSLMMIEEDHLRLQVFQSGLNLAEAWRIADEIDMELEKSLSYAFDATLGYLTACPTNVGTGIRASCMLHLPSLVITKQIQKVLQALSKLNLAVRGLYGEGTQALGSFFQFSNQITLGQPETEIISNLEGVIKQVITHEREAREYLRKKRKTKMEDQVWRALGVLKSARLISSQEAIQLLSLVQTGVDTGIIEGRVTHRDLNQLFLWIQPGHLQKMHGSELSAADRDIQRADRIRTFFSKLLL